MGRLKSLARALAPLHLVDDRLPGARQRQRILLYGMQRSGQHLVISWICAHLAPILHVNHCRFHPSAGGYVLRPISHRYVVHRSDGIHDFRRADWRGIAAEPALRALDRVLYNIEDCDLADRRITRLVAARALREVLVVRDPRNWLASTLAHGRWDREAIAGKGAVAALHYQAVTDRPGIVTVRYERFVADPEYRRKLARELGMVFDPAADAASLGTVRDFGGGSSFSGLESNESAESRKERWRSYEDDPTYRTLLEPLSGYVSLFS